MADFGFIPYSVTSQRQTEELTQDGRFVTVWVVNYQAPSGTTGSVKIPVAMYEPAYVDSVIQTELRRIESVHRLGGEPAEPIE